MGRDGVLEHAESCYDVALSIFLCVNYCTVYLLMTAMSRVYLVVFCTSSYVLPVLAHKGEYAGGPR